jgi:protein-tyrosine phosphatase
MEIGILQILSPESDTQSSSCWLISILFSTLVAKYPFDDHNAPPFQLMEPYCEDMATFLSDPKNVAIVHCKAGKV